MYSCKSIKPLMNSSFTRSCRSRIAAVLSTTTGCASATLAGNDVVGQPVFKIIHQPSLDLSFVNKMAVVTNMIPESAVASVCCPRDGLFANGIGRQTTAAACTNKKPGKDMNACVIGAAHAHVMLKSCHDLRMLVLRYIRGTIIASFRAARRNM